VTLVCLGRAILGLLVPAALALVACAPVAPLPTKAPASTPAPTASPTPSPVPSPTPLPTASPVPTPTPLTTITQESDFGTVTLEIPAPFIPVGVDVAVESHPAEDAPRDLRDAGVHQPFHILLPQDLTFSEPIRVSLALPTKKFTRADGSIAIAYLAIRGPDGNWDWLRQASMLITGPTTVISGTSTHLGALFAWSDRTDLQRFPEELGSHGVGEAFRPLVTITPRDSRDHPVAYVTPPEFQNRDPSVIEVGPPLTTPTYREWQCRAVGDFTVTFSAWLTNFGADNVFLGSNLGLPATEGTLSYDMTGSCATPASPTPNPTPNSTPSSSP
jgi:hypothetical protein